MGIINYLNEVPMTTIFTVAAIVGPILILGLAPLQDRLHDYCHEKFHCGKKH